MEKTSILIVDDEKINRMLLNEYLMDAGYDAMEAEGGIQALELLNAEPDRYSAVLLDRMMPDMEGLTVLKKMKQTESLKHIPVIMQTAKAMRDEINEGLRSGSYYYLTKPFDKTTLLTVLNAAVEQFKSHSTLIAELALTTNTLGLMKQGMFEYKTTADVRSLAKLIALACPNPQAAVMGISELLLNAIEHGNLGITYDEKTTLIKNNKLLDEIDRRLQMDEYKSKIATLAFTKTDTELRFEITDMGQGFDFSKFVNVDLSEVLDSHGRGIAMARLLSFSKIEYKGIGNQVEAVISL